MWKLDSLHCFTKIRRMEDAQMKTQLHHELLPPCCQLATAMFHSTFSYLPFVLPTIYIGGKK